MKRSVASSLAVTAIYLYRNTLALIMLHSCRFSPSCSRYAQEAIETYGFFLGARKALKRIARCHPFCEGGADPVR